MVQMLRLSAFTEVAWGSIPAWKLRSCKLHCVAKKKKKKKIEYHPLGWPKIMGNAQDNVAINILIMENINLFIKILILRLHHWYRLPKESI